MPTGALSRSSAPATDISERDGFLPGSTHVFLPDGAGYVEAAAVRGKMRNSPKPALGDSTSRIHRMEAARALAETGDAAPTQARLRRAVSTAYYAMFHTLAASAADLFIGAGRTARWSTAGPERRAGKGQEFPAEIRNFAKAFVMLQTERQQADYAADAYQKSDVPWHIASAELAIRHFEQADIGARRGFAAHVL